MDSLRRLANGGQVRSPIAKIAIGTTVVIAAVIGLLVVSMMQQAKVSCEVCITFRGGTKCRTALGPTRDDAIKTATDNACGFLASGMANAMACSATPPTSVSCDDH